MLFALLTEVQVEGKSIWTWVQQSGLCAMTRLEAQLQTLTQGNLPDEEAMTATTKALPLLLLLGADGVMAPFRPQGGSATGKTVWREVKVGILVRLGQRLTKTGHYLDKHQDYIDYAKFKELGLPIGSGMVESVCKWLI